MDDIIIPTACELHVQAKNPSSTIHGKPIPPDYTSITVEQIVGRNNENLELDFVGGDGEKALRDALHEIILWCKDDIKLIGDTAAPVDPLFLPTMIMMIVIPLRNFPHHRLRLGKGPGVLQLLQHQKKQEKDIIHPTGWTDIQKAEKSRKEDRP